MSDAVQDRAHIVASLKEELMGPSKEGKEIDCSKEISFEKFEESFGPWIQQGTGEEILQRERPTARYGAGILFPVDAALPQETPGSTDDEGARPDIDEQLPETENPGSNGSWEDLENAFKKTENRRSNEEESQELDISGVNAFRQNSMGLSFLAEITEDSELLIDVVVGRYKRKTVRITGQDRIWWLRSSVTGQAKFNSEQLNTDRLQRIRPTSFEPQNAEGLDLRVEAYSRPYQSNGGVDSQGTPLRLITVCLVNRTPIGTYMDESCTFQSWFRASLVTSNGAPMVHPYPSRSNVSEFQEDEVESIALLYRDVETFGVGHGCAADWIPGSPSDRVNSITAEAMPECDVPSITPSISRQDGSSVEVSMSALAGMVEGDDGLSSLSEIIDLYGDWIDTQAKRTDIPNKLVGAKDRHIASCTRALTRMEVGLRYLETDPLAYRAFQLANRAVLLQQLAAGGDRRLIKYDRTSRRYFFPEPYKEPDPKDVPPGRGNWRPFQIAFLLTCLQSTADPSTDERETVELLWFPTGGGKTEAYLGLTAFSIFLRRLKDPNDVGVHVLMRYTLRLLTSQQFQRASALMCAMEVIRREDQSALGTTPISIGLWLGGGTTPNRRSDAEYTFRALRAGNQPANSFAVLQCPWCRAQIGPHTEGPRGSSKVAGYELQGSEVVIACSDNNCHFFDRLPLHVVDDYIYEKRPDLIIGTIDKFATLSWRPETRSMFGLGPDGNQEFSPPGLIIQDELHLISGPLGSMAGLYEGLIEELCTDRRFTPEIRPKIISSTATIRRSEQQIEALYGRADSALFPPPGLDAGDSFFSRFAKDTDGNLAPGKKFVGVYTANFPSLQTTQVRTFSSLLQSPAQLPEPDRDPWWTLVAFFNSLRELGNTLSLMQHDIRNYLWAIHLRTGKERTNPRYVNKYLELTGRLRDEEVGPALDLLEVGYDSTEGRPLDVCLASNIIEVGIDIDRLALMVVVGQPKTTSQYIQVTGRVGRQWQKVPGLVVTIYGVARPRDRSHFEKFRTYHERLYANVEPTSVTPFAPPVLGRALHAALIGFAKQYGGPELQDSPYPYPEALIDRFKAMLTKRVALVDAGESDNFKEEIDRCIRHWKDLERTEWGSPAGIPGDNDLMAAPSSYIPSNLRGLIWATPTSLRNVDAECEIDITQQYLREEPDV